MNWPRSLTPLTSQNTPGLESQYQSQPRTRGRAGEPQLKAERLRGVVLFGTTGVVVEKLPRAIKLNRRTHEPKGTQRG
jgi:hypothetical protein